MRFARVHAKTPRGSGCAIRTARWVPFQGERFRFGTRLGRASASASTFPHRWAVVEHRLERGDVLRRQQVRLGGEHLADLEVEPAELEDHPPHTLGPPLVPGVPQRLRLLLQVLPVRPGTQPLAVPDQAPHVPGDDGHEVSVEAHRPQHARRHQRQHARRDPNGQGRHSQRTHRSGAQRRRRPGRHRVERRLESVPAGMRIAAPPPPPDDPDDQPAGATRVGRRGQTDQRAEAPFVFGEHFDPKRDAPRSDGA